MIVEGKTDAGLVRKTNQDDFACGLYGGGAGAWAVVCDGMGGVERRQRRERSCREAYLRQTS
jgi:serine/threonine protein phosphatase PrpC